MAIQKQDMDLTSSLSLVRDTDADATGEMDMNVGAAVLWLLSVDNSANAAQKVYFKLWDATAPTVGTTAPDMVIPCPGGSTVTMAIPEGLSFATGISCACVTAGGTGGTTNPTNDVVTALVIQ